MKHKKLLVVVAAITLAILLRPKHAHAATLNVNTGNDIIAANSLCTFSEAIQNINDQAQTNTDCAAGNGSSDTIVLLPGTVTLTADAPEIERDVIINGAGKNSSFLDGNNFQFRGITSDTSGSPITITLSNFTVRRSSNVGQTTNGGGAYFSNANVTLQSMRFTDNQTDAVAGSYGGGFMVGPAGDVTISDSNFDNNRAGTGGGFYVGLVGYDFSLSNSEISDNLADSGGGGGAHVSAENITITDSNVFGNTVANFDYAGGLRILGQGLVSIDGLNVYDNSTDGQIGGISISTEDLEATNIAVFNNSATAFVGGMQIYAASDTSTIQLSNATIYNNQSQYLGGIVLSAGGVPDSAIVQNISVIDNISDSEGAGPAGIGVYGADVDPAYKLQNVLLSGNLDSGTPANCGLITSGSLYVLPYFSKL